jgi:hypothetical protein
MLSVKNWTSFQHYGKRRPPWIKLHHGLLDNVDFLRLPIASKALAPLLWLVASEFEDGKIDTSFEDLAYRFRMSDRDFALAVIPLMERKFFFADSEMIAACRRHASTTLAPCEQVATLSRGEREGESEVEEEAFQKDESQSPVSDSEADLQGSTGDWL